MSPGAPETLPLLADFEPGRAIAWLGGRRVSQGEFLAQAQALASRLPAASHTLNLCVDRYRFMLAFAAVCLRGQTNLLPSSPAEAALDAVRTAYPGSHTLDDAAVPLEDAGSATQCPQIEARQIAAVLFTSGSTGMPQAHPKTWKTLGVIALHLSQRLLDETPAQIVATVPPQHMYGLETTVLMGLGGRCAIHSGRPFFPQDVVRALAEVPEPRVLVTTPVHLRALAADGAPLPALRFVLSATAPLSLTLAAECEAAWQAPVLEIYGCTEAGSTAARRTLDGPRWRLLPGMALREQVDGTAVVHAAHLPEPVPLQDILELEDPEHFRLIGRSGDLLKVAGKRASLAHLTQQLQAIPGVEDAVIFNAGEGETARPAALVVAPGLSEAAILQALARQVDPVFLPRPLRKVARLPRNELGKLPRQRLLDLMEPGHD